MSISRLSQFERRIASRAWTKEKSLKKTLGLLELTLALLVREIRKTKKGSGTLLIESRRDIRCDKKVSLDDRVARVKAPQRPPAAHICLTVWPPYLG